MSKKKRRSGKVRLYRFYNIDRSPHGRSFAMCDFHHDKYHPPNNVIMENIASSTEWPCNQCEGERREKEKP